jgi:hypothetical protein
VICAHTIDGTSNALLYGSNIQTLLFKARPIMRSTATVIYLTARRDQLRCWLGKHAAHAVDDQRHLEEGSEREYWHHGYHSALSDVLDLLIAEEEIDSADTSAAIRLA